MFFSGVPRRLGACLSRRAGFRVIPDVWVLVSGVPSCLAACPGRSGEFRIRPGAWVLLLAVVACLGSGGGFPVTSRLGQPSCSQYA